MARRPTVLVLPGGELLRSLLPDEVRGELAKFADARYNDLGRNLTQEELMERVADADACITSWGSPQFTPEVVAAAPRLKIIAHAAGTVKPYVTEAVFARGIIVTGGAPAIARYVGEMALALTLASLRRLIGYDRSLKDERGWRSPEVGPPETLFEQRVGLIGFGVTGREFAAVLKPFRVELLCCDPHVEAGVIEAAGGRAASLEEILSTCKVISVHAASLPSTKHLLDVEQLRMIQDGAVLVNTARGSVIDTAALVEELKTGRFSAALDVFDPEEPLPSDHALRDLPNVILTPHVSGPVGGRRADLGKYAVECVRIALSGETPPGAITLERLQTLA